MNELIRRLFIALLCALVSGCQYLHRPSFTLDPNTAPPTAEGVYALDKGVLTRLTDHSPAPDVEDNAHRAFSKDVRFLIFEKWIADPRQDINAISILDWRTAGEHPMLNIGVATKPLPNHPETIVVVPEHPLRPGLYTLQIGDKTRDYQFGVEATDIPAYWRSVLDEYPDNWQAHNHLGAILYMSGDFKGAYPHFQRAVELNPSNCESHNNLGLALNRLGRKEEAIQQYQAALKLIDDTAIETNLANDLLELKRYDDATSAYRRAIELNSRNGSAHCNLGYTLMEEGKVGEAITEFRKAIEIDPGMREAQVDLKEALKIQAGNK